MNYKVGDRVTILVDDWDGSFLKEGHVTTANPSFVWVQFSPGDRRSYNNEDVILTEIYNSPLMKALE